MAPDDTLARLPLADLAARLASGEPLPAGGSAAAALAALGAALVAKSFRRDPGGPDGPGSAGGAHPGAEVYQRGRADELDALRERATELVDEDAHGHQRLRALAGGPAAGTPAEEHRVALEKARQRALEVPFATMELAVGALRLAAVGAPDTDPARAADGVAGALCLRAALDVADVFVRESAARVEDRASREQHLAAAVALATEAGALVDEVRRSSPGASAGAGTGAATGGRP